MELDILSRRYNKLPSELLACPIDMYQFNILVACEGMKEEKKCSCNLMGAESDIGHFKECPLAPAPRAGEKYENFLEHIVIEWERQGRTEEQAHGVRNFLSGLGGRAIRKMLASSTAEAERKERERLRNSAEKQYAIGQREGIIYGEHGERERIAMRIEHEGINLPAGKMDSAAIEAVSFFIRTGKQRFEIK